MQLEEHSDGWTRGWDWGLWDPKVDSPNKWVGLTLFLPEPLPSSSLPDVHSSLWTFFFVALVRSTVLMALLAHRPAEEPTRTEETDGQTETERQRLSEREESVCKKKKPRRALFYRRERGDLRGGRRGKPRVERNRRYHARRRGGVWSNLLRGLLSPGFIFHKLCTGLARAHTCKKRGLESLILTSFIPTLNVEQRVSPDDF